MFVISFMIHDQRRFVCEGEGGYPYITNDIIGHRNFCSSKAAYDYLDFLDRFKLWDGLPITRIEVRVEQVLCLFSLVGGAYRDEERGV